MTTEQRAATIGYFTLPVRDLEKGKRFYNAVLGWEFGEPKHEGYAHAENTNMPAAGLNMSDAQHATIFFRVDDIRAAVAKVRELGGTAAEPSESNSGWSSACEDDQGTKFALWQPAEGY